VSSVLRPCQHSIGYMGDGFYRSKDPTNSITHNTFQQFNNLQLAKLLHVCNTWSM